MKEYDIKITEVLEKTAESREEAEAIASENWNNSMYDMDSAEDYADVSFQAGEERDISPPELMDVLLVKPGEYPKPVQIGTELEDLQEAVGGYIQCVYPYEEPVGIICNEEGKLNGAVLNRALYGEDGELQDIIAGDFLVVGLTEESFGSLTDEQMKRFDRSRDVKGGIGFAGRSGKQDCKSCGHDNKADCPECSGCLHEIPSAPGTGQGEKGDGESGKGQRKCDPARQTDGKRTDRAESGRIQHGYRQDRSSRF